MTIIFNAQQFAAHLAEREDRWPLLEGWADAWCQSFHKQDGYLEVELDQAEDRLSLRLPASLKQLYRFAGRRLSKLNDPLVEPESLEVSQNILPFWAENQYVMTWGAKIDDLPLDDPPIYVDLNGCDSFGSSFMTPNRLVQQNETLSEFVFQMVVWGYMQWEVVHDDAQGEEEVTKLLRAYRALGFPDWTQEVFQREQGFRNTAVKFYGNETGLALVTSDSYARCVPRDKDRFLRHNTKGR